MKKEEINLYSFNELSEDQKEYLSKSYDWIVNVLQTQKRMLPIDELYMAYPFKKKGLTKEGLQILSNTMTKELFELEQKKETEKEVKNLIESGMEKIPFEQYVNLLSDFGLKIDEYSILKHYNTLNEQKYLSATFSAIDETGHGCFNTYSDFYKKEVVNNTEKYNKLKEFRNKYFTMYQDKYIMSL